MAFLTGLKSLLNRPLYIFSPSQLTLVSGSVSFFVFSTLRFSYLNIIVVVVRMPFVYTLFNGGKLCFMRVLSYYYCSCCCCCPLMMMFLLLHFIYIFQHSIRDETIKYNFIISNHFIHL